MWVADKVEVNLPSNKLNQSYGVRSSYSYDFVKFFDDPEDAIYEAEVMNNTNVEEPNIVESIASLQRQA